MNAEMKVIIIVLLNFLFGVNTSRILMVFNHFGKSHYIQGRSLGKALARAGNEVTMISPFEDTGNDEQEGYIEIVLEGLIETVATETNFVKGTPVPTYIFILQNNDLFADYTNASISHPKFQTLLNSNQSFDIIILEDLFYTALRGLSCHFKTPLILFNPFAPTTLVNDIAGLPAPPSYVPNLWMGYSDTMTFWERSINFFFTIADILNLHNRFYPLQQQLLEKHFPSCHSLDSVNKNVSVILINSHESVNVAIPSVPNVVNILGFHLKKENSLPQDLQEYMDSARNGVILFSFGSFVYPSQMNVTIKEAILKSLGKLKEQVIWKTDEETISGKSDNIKLSKWLPQEDLLAHPNTKLFITHAGLTSTIETIYHGVPVLAVPLIGDQFTNAARMSELGLGLTTSLNNITEGYLDFLLQELLTNKKYRQNIKKRSDLLRDRPIKPMDLAIYWVEFVIRHKGAPHLRVAGLNLTWYQYLLLDVVLVWSSIVIIVIYSAYILIRKLIQMISRRKKTKLS